MRIKARESGFGYLPDIMNSFAPSIQTPGPSTANLRKVSVFLPKEHGSWSLALEPLVLGLLVAPSAGGISLALAMAAVFLVRRPLKLALSPGNGRWGVQIQVTVLFVLYAGLGLVETTIPAGVGVLWPLLLVAPLGGLFAYFDRQGETRAVAAELCGSAAFALLPAALATVAGWPAFAALGLAGVALTRSVPTVLTVRTALRLSKGRPATPAIPLLASAGGFGFILLLATAGQVRWFALVPAALLLLRTLWWVSPLRPSWTARRFGVFESLVGATCVLLNAFAYRL